MSIERDYVLEDGRTTVTLPDEQFTIIEALEEIRREASRAERTNGHTRQVIGALTLAEAQKTAVSN